MDSTELNGPRVRLGRQQLDMLGSPNRKLDTESERGHQATQLCLWLAHKLNSSPEELDAPGKQLKPFPILKTYLLLSSPTLIGEKTTCAKTDCWHAINFF